MKLLQELLHSRKGSAEDHVEMVAMFVVGLFVTAAMVTVVLIYITGQDAGQGFGSIASDLIGRKVR